MSEQSYDKWSVILTGPDQIDDRSADSLEGALGMVREAAAQYGSDFQITLSGYSWLTGDHPQIPFSSDRPLVKPTSSPTWAETWKVHWEDSHGGGTEAFASAEGAFSWALGYVRSSNLEPFTLEIEGPNGKVACPA